MLRGRPPARRSIRPLATVAVTLLALTSAALAPLAPLARAAPAPAPPRPASLVTGFTDSVYGEAAPLRELWLTKTVQADAQMVLLDASWAAIAPVRPRHPADPADPVYRWGGLDAEIQAAVAHGLRVTLAVGGAPSWAEGPHRPAGAPAGTWRPDARAYGAFATAIARRYGGSFRDPADPSVSLPRVRYWQAWGEPNLNVHITPQWVRRGGRWIAASPLVYRRLLNAFYAGVTRVHPHNFVVTAGTAPFGDPPGGERVPPQQFVRSLLCVHGPRLTPTRCPHPAHLDALAHDPYSISGPFAHALDPGDVSIPDIGRLSSALHAAQRSGRVLPAGKKQLWVTEFSWDSNPPDPHGVPAMRQAQWLQDALFELWREGVSVAIWYQVRDQPPVPSYADSYQSGVYLLNGRPKPSLTAFRLPFVVVREHGRSRFWARAPLGGRLLLQRRDGRRWRTQLTRSVRTGQVLFQPLPARPPALLRARIGSLVSLPAKAP
ncbi:MAG: hypothetical protein ACYCUM_07825 [Solirubrobacteraceae bacterium]